MIPFKPGLLALAFLITPAMEPALAQDAPPVSAPTLSLVMEGVVDIGMPRQMGESPNGVRREIPITGGTFSGPDFAATVLPGGSDWQLQRADGGLEIVADYTLQTEDGVFIRVINEGVSYPASDDRTRYTMTTPRFIAPAGRYGWLNEAVFVGTLRVSGDTPPKILIGVYRAE